MVATQQFARGDVMSINHITITVAGLRGAGKSTLIAHIYLMFRKLGFNAIRVVSDDGFKYSGSAAATDEAIRGMRANCSITLVEQATACQPAWATSYPGVSGRPLPEFRTHVDSELGSHASQWSKDTGFSMQARPGLGAQKTVALPKIPYQLREYLPGQWWFSELESLVSSRLPPTDNQRRALAVAITLADSVFTLNSDPKETP